MCYEDSIADRSIKRIMPIVVAKEWLMEPAPVFEQTYRSYLTQLVDLDLAPLVDVLGIDCHGRRASITLFNRQFNVSAEGVVGEDGRRPNLGVCVVLFKYLLLGGEGKSQDTSLVTFKDFRESGPLTHYFAHTVEGAIARHFARASGVAGNSGGSGKVSSRYSQMATDCTRLTTGCPARSSCNTGTWRNGLSRACASLCCSPACRFTGTIS